MEKIVLKICGPGCEPFAIVPIYFGVMFLVVAVGFVFLGLLYVFLRR